MQNKKSLTIIFFTVFIDLMGFGILMPILPTFGSIELGISDFEIGLVVAVYSLAQFLFNPVLGKYSDRVGRRPLLLITLLITCSSYIMFTFSTNFWILFISRLIAGIGGSNIGVAQAYIADVTTKEKRSKGMGLIGAAFGLGFVFGPFIGGILATYSYAFAGYFAAGFSLLAFIFAFFFLPESRKLGQAADHSKVKLIDFDILIKALKTPLLGFLISIYFVIVFSMANIYGTFSLLGLNVYGLSDREIGYQYGLIGLVGAIIQGGSIDKMVKFFKEKTLVFTGIISMVIGLAFLPYGQNFTGLAVFIVFLGCGTGILHPVITSMVSRYSPDDSQGEILGLNQSIAALARVLGPLWGGFAYQFLGYQFPFLTGAVFTFLTLIIVIFAFRSKTYMKEN